MRLAIVLVTSLSVAACSDKATTQVELPPRPVLTFRVANADIVAGRTMPGQPRSAHEAALSFRVGGRILERRFKTGDTIKQNDIVATLDPAPYQAEVESVTATLERAQAAYRNMARQAERDRQLFQKDIIAKTRLESSETNTQQSLAEVRSLEATLDRRKLDLEYTVLRAPFSGVVSAVFAENLRGGEAAAVDHAHYRS
jgi:RND family efflux transporter MFP subunit